MVIRAASRVEPSSSQGQLQLSFSKGVIFEKNVAATGMERLRKVVPCMEILSYAYAHAARH